MRILVLDDNEIVVRAPEDFFIDPHDYREDEIVQTKDVVEFTDKFFREEWDEIWIDHDLGLGVMNGKRATKNINDYILGSNRKMVSNPVIKITTMNSAVAGAMADDLERCGLTVHICPISMLRDFGVSRGVLI